MKTGSKDTNSLWKWKGNMKKKKNGNQFPVSEYLRQKVEENTLGPGFGAGIGCGIGVGFGLVGGIGYGGWPWNHLNLVFGFGAGCGVGFGFGFGQGIGYGSSLDSLESNLSRDTSDSNRKFIIS
ncbi:hypothetical protein F3Y22_tig00020944pilonHSYRG00008 [Hibiscus syriacus]|uniref:Uncharacterized protein n=1 Tax=Hibiscus syriacus TaxID=106335 RepID=A0A6A3BUE0_HIBSY|nr:hypothetical protein F3Y22_tig00020944pilonHSYRG00008 [Hibiscus syriacus]